MACSPGIDPLSLLPFDESKSSALEAFIGYQLNAAGVWDSPRASDGIAWCHIAAQTADRVSLCGRIWEVADQTCHTFWLDVERAEEGRWTLYYDAVATSSNARRLAETPSALARPDQLEWRVTLSG